jgi:hypothetical protein
MKISQIRALSVARGDRFFMEEKRITLNGSALVASATAFSMVAGERPVKHEGYLFATMEKSGYFKIWFFMLSDHSITEIEGNEKYTTISEIENKIHSVENQEVRNKPNRLVYSTSHGLEIIPKSESGIRLAVSQ